MKRLIFAALLAVPLAACGGGNVAPAQTVHQKESAAAVQNQTNLDAKEPPPILNDSIERANLIERAKFLNNGTFQSCVYLFANNGALVAYYPVKRKVSSLNSYLQAGDQIVRDPYYSQPISSSMAGGSQGLSVEQADIDGAYGQNADGIFFFTQDTGEYVEWKGDYLYTSNCSKPASQPMLVRNVADK